MARATVPPRVGTSNRSHGTVSSACSTTDAMRWPVLASAGCCTNSRLPAKLLRSEEHTSELQSQSNLVCRLLLEKKKLRPRLRALHLRQPDPSSGAPSRRVMRSFTKAWTTRYDDTSPMCGADPVLAQRTTLSRILVECSYSPKTIRICPHDSTIRASFP